MSLSTVSVIPLTVASTLPAYCLARADSGHARLPSLSVGRLSHRAIQIAFGRRRGRRGAHRSHCLPFLRSVVSNPVIFDPYLQAFMARQCQKEQDSPMSLFLTHHDGTEKVHCVCSAVF